MRQIKWRYQLFWETCSATELGLYSTYGIQVAQKTAIARKIEKSIHDVSTLRERVERSAYLFTKHQLSPIHLEEAIDDMLAEL